MKTIILADIYGEDPFRPCGLHKDGDGVNPSILPKGMIHRYVDPSDLTDDDKTVIAEALGDPDSSLDEDEGPMMYHHLTGTQEHLEELADCYRSDAIQKLWHIYYEFHQDESGEPFHDGGDDFDYDWGTVELLVQFAHYLNDPEYLRPVLDSFEDITPGGYSHPYKPREEVEGVFDDFNMPYWALKDAMGKLGA